MGRRDGKLRIDGATPKVGSSPRERRTTAVAPFVEVAEQDGRHRRQIAESSQEGADLIQSRKAKQTEVGGDHPEFPFAEIQFRDDRSARLPPGSFMRNRR